MKKLFTFLSLFLFSLGTFAQGFILIDSTYSFNVHSSETLFDGSIHQEYSYDSTGEVLYINDACNVAINVYPYDIKRLYVSKDSTNNVLQTSRDVWDAKTKQYSSYFDVGGRKSTYIYHGNLFLFKIIFHRIKSWLPHLANGKGDILSNSIGSTFLENDSLKLVVSFPLSGAVNKTCPGGYPRGFSIFRNGQRTDVGNNFLNNSTALQDGDKIVGRIDPKSCGLLNGGYDCLDYDFDVATDKLYVKGLLTENLSKMLPDEITVVPNPTLGILYLSSTIDRGQVADFSGRLLIEATDFHELDLQTLSAGMYFIHLEVAGKRTTRKIIKK